MYSSDDKEAQKPKATEFYRHLRPLAIVCKVLGTFPLTGVRSSDGRKLRHRWLSLGVLWDVTLFTLSGLAFNRLACVKSANETLSTEPEFWTEIVIDMALAQNGTQFLLCHHTAWYLPDLLNEFESYYQKRSLSHNVKVLRRCGIIVTLASVFFFAVTSVAAFLNFHALDGYSPERYLIAVAYLLISMSVTLPLAVYTFFCLSLNVLYRELKTSLKELLKKKSAMSADGTLLCELRLRHGELSQITGDLGRYYGWHLLTNMSFLVLETVLYMYIFLILTESRDLLILVLVSHHLTVNLTVFVCTHVMTDTANSVVQDLRMVPVSRLSPKNQAEVQMFMTQILACPVHVSAAGYFVVGKTQITAILSSVATYLIVMIQFSPFLKQLTMR